MKTDTLGTIRQMIQPAMRRVATIKAKVKVRMKVIIAKVLNEQRSLKVSM